MASYWEILAGYFRHYRVMIAESAALSEMARVMINRGVPEQSVPSYLREVQLLFRIDLSTIPDTYGVQLLKKFLFERSVSDQMNQMVRSTAGDVPVNLPGMVAGFSDHARRISGLNSGSSTGTFSEDLFVYNPARTIPTGIAFLDEPMGGGRAEEEVVIIYGVTGAGKTRLTSMITGNTARAEYLSARANGGRPRPVFFFTYETDPVDIKRRVISGAARVDKDRLCEIPWETTLTSSRRGTGLLPYETTSLVQRLNDPRLYLGELERIDEVRPFLGDSNIRYFDHRGSSQDPMAGSGFIAEIESQIAKSVEELGAPPSVIVIDYMDLVCRRYVDGKANLRDREGEHRYALKRFGGEIRRTIAEKYKCTVFITKQLSGEANSRRPTMKQGYADGADCRTTADEVDFTFQFGPKDNRHNSVVMWHGKTRRAAPLPKEYSVLEYVPAFEWFADTRQIIHQGIFKDPEEVTGFHGETEPATTLHNLPSIGSTEY